MTVLLADAKPGDLLNVALLIALAAAVAVSGIFAALALRRWAKRDAPAEAFTLQDLREMKARGQIDEREFLAMRAAILGTHGDARARGPDKSATPNLPDAPDNLQSPL